MFRHFTKCLKFSDNLQIPIFYKLTLTYVYIYIYTYICRNSSQPFERLSSPGIMGEQLSAPLKPFDDHRKYSTVRFTGDPQSPLYREAIAPRLNGV